MSCFTGNRCSVRRSSVALHVLAAWHTTPASAFCVTCNFRRLSWTCRRGASCSSQGSRPQCRAQPRLQIPALATDECAVTHGCGSWNFAPTRLRGDQSREWVTQSDPWPKWPTEFLTHDPCDPWPMGHRHRARHPILAQALRRFIDYPALHLDIVYVHTPLSCYIIAHVSKLHTQTTVNLEFVNWKLNYCIT